MKRRVGKKVYDSAKWQKLRQAYMESRNWICERCGRPATICHHKEYLTAENIYNAEIAFNPENLECLCQDCHNLEHEHFQRVGVVFSSNADVVGERMTKEKSEFVKAREAIARLEVPPVVDGKKGSPTARENFSESL